jgi:hypothetical protein
MIIEGVVASGKLQTQSDVRRGDYRHIDPDLYPGSLNVVAPADVIMNTFPVAPFQIIDHWYWDDPVMWWRGSLEGTPVIVTYCVKYPWQTHIELLARTHLRTEHCLVDGSPVVVHVDPW